MYNDAFLSYCDKNRPTFIELDAIGHGLEAVLLQGNIYYASKSLSGAEKHYSNIVRELLGVVWTIEHFHNFTFANKVNIISDHRPLHEFIVSRQITCVLQSKNYQVAI